MSSKRHVLDLLSRDELADLADRHAVIARDRRSRGALADALDADGPDLADLLAGFSRDRLKELCRALGLDDGGREKAAIIARLAGAAVASAEVAEFWGAYKEVSTRAPDELRGGCRFLSREGAMPREDVARMLLQAGAA